MSLRTLTLAAVAVTAFSLDARAIVYRDDETDAFAKALASQPQFSGTGILTIPQDLGTGTIIAPNWVLTAKHVVTADGSITPAGNAATFNYAGGSQVSDAIYSDPNSDIALVHFATALPGNLAIIVPNVPGSGLNVANQLIWNVGYGNYSTYSNQTHTTGLDGARRGGTNITDKNQGQFLGFDNNNTAGTEFESSTAPGDSGGPMFQQTGYQWRVVAEVFGAGSAGFIDTDVATNNFIRTTTGLTFTARTAPTALFWNSTYTNTTGNNSNVVTTPVDGAGNWNTTRLNFTDKTYTFSYENGTLLPVTFGLGNGAAGTVTLTTPINISNLTFAAPGSGNYTIAGTSVNALTLQASGSSITVNAGVASTISAPMNGTGALTKLGPGTLTLSGANGYTGGTTLSAGGIVLSGTGTLGGTSGALTMANGTGLDLGGTSQGVGAFNGGGTVTNNSTTATATLTVGNGNPTTGSLFSGALQNGTGTLALVKTGTGTQTLTNSLNTYSGGTTLTGGTLAITNNSALGTGGLTYGGTAGSTSMLNLGGTTYTAPTLAFTTAANTGFTGSASNGNLVVTGAAGLNFIGSNTGATTDALNLAALTSFTYNQSAQSFNVYGSATAGTTGTTFAPTTVTQVTLATTNTITAASVNVGAAGSGSVSVFPLSRLDLGANNTINTGTLLVGNYRGNGLLDFAAAQTNPSVTLRGTDGNSAVASMVVGQNASGAGSSFGTVDLSAGSVNAAINALTVGYQSTNNAQTAQGTFTMGTGTMNLGTLVLADNTDANTGAVASVGTFTQNAGIILANTLTLGSNRTAAAPTITGTYNLGTATTAANLSVAAINMVGSSTNAATATTNAASRATLNWNNGTISAYDSGAYGGNVSGGAPTQNLTISGLTGGGAGGDNKTLTLNLVDAPGVTHTFSAGVGQSITVASTALITGTGALTKAGLGTLTLAGTASHTGATAVSLGSMFVNGALTGTSGLSVASGGTLGGAGTITTGSNGGVTLASGGRIAPGASGAGSAGMLTIALGTGTFDASAATAANNGAFTFDLASTAASDSLQLLSGLWNLGTGTLGLNDFSFTTLAGFGAGTYTLFSGTSTISAASLDGANLTGTVGGRSATLSDSGTSILLTVAVPEPGTWALLVLGAAGTLGLRRRR